MPVTKLEYPIWDLSQVLIPAMFQVMTAVYGWHTEKTY